MMYFGRWKAQVYGSKMDSWFQQPGITNNRKILSLDSKRYVGFDSRTLPGVSSIYEYEEKLNKIRNYDWKEKFIYFLFLALVRPWANERSELKGKKIKVFYFDGWRRVERLCDLNLAEKQCRERDQSCELGRLVGDCESSGVREFGSAGVRECERNPERHGARWTAPPICGRSPHLFKTFRETPHSRENPTTHSINLSYTVEQSFFRHSSIPFPHRNQIKYSLIRSMR